MRDLAQKRALPAPRRRRAGTSKRIPLIPNAAIDSRDETNRLQQEEVVSSLPPTSLRRNVLANFAGSLWTAALGFLFIPIFVKYLGVEAYGLIGFYAALQAVFGIMDFGLGTTLNREMARLSVLPDGLRQQRDVLRTLESLYWAASIGVGVMIVMLARPFAEHWVHVRTLPIDSVVHSVRLMGVIIALQFPFAFYQGGLMGLERQTLLNTIVIAAGTLRSVGAAALLAFVSPSIVTFFGWQLFVMLLQTVSVVFFLWHFLSAPAAQPRFRSELLRRVWRFSAVVAANAIIGTLLTQLDKILLSRLVPLKELGYYSIAASVAAVPWLVIVPINAAFYPRFAQAVERRSSGELAELYHRAAQLVSVTLLPLCVTLILFSRELVIVWTGNPEIASKTSLIISLLVTGTMLNGIASPGGYLQSAAGWPELTMYTNAAAAVVLVPALTFATIRYGARGAAAVWVVLNSFYILFTIPLMHRRLLRGEKWRWYGADVGLPLAGVIAVVSVARWAFPATTSRPIMLLCLGLTWSLSVVICTSLSSEVRQEAARLWNALPSRAGRRSVR
jgi:O-antigen/teichoic acid export membrane protein